MKVLIPNPTNLEQIKLNIQNDGLENLHVLADFDRTLTYGAIDGVKTPSIIAMLRDGKHLANGYAEKAHDLFNKYHPIEINSKIDFGERKAAMQEWWNAHFKLLIDSGLTKADLEDIINNGPVRFREGVLDFLDFLKDNNIPLVIVSAGVSGEAIQMFFKRSGKDFSNVHYLSNFFRWDESGKAISNIEPVIHSLNKDETVLKAIPHVYTTIENRKNVILMGDGLGDIGMVEGFDYSNLIKIGFYNFEEDNEMEAYLKDFDVVLEGDGDFNYVNDLIKELN